MSIAIRTLPGLFALSFATNAAYAVTTIEYDFASGHAGQSRSQSR